MAVYNAKATRNLEAA